jgi:hypothetical protein
LFSKARVSSIILFSVSVRSVGITRTIEERRDRFQVARAEEASFNPVATIDTPAHDEFAFIDLRNLSHQPSSTPLTAHRQVSSHTRPLQLDLDCPESTRSLDLRKV